MAMRRRSGKRRSGCPVSTALEIFGDPWTLLVVRDLMLRGVHTFDGFIAAGEDIATNILADRLDRLRCDGIITSRRDSTDRRRIRYRLTEKGMQLAPIIVEIVIWSAAHNRTEAPPEIVAAMKRDRQAFIAELRAKWNV